MMYYILYPNQVEADAIKDDNQLGEDNGFGVFWAGTGLRILMHAIENNPDILPHMSIYNDQGKGLAIEEFLDKISKLKVRINNG